MDYGWLNDQWPLAVHKLDYEGQQKALQRMPEGYNPYNQHYEETEKDALTYYLVNGDPLVQQIPPSFGVLCHPNPNNGLYYLRFIKGLDHGMRRTEDGGAYEAAKFNQRLNPRHNRVGNYRGDGADQKRTEDDMKAANLAMFPNIGGLVTSVSCEYEFVLRRQLMKLSKGLYRASGVQFQLNETEQTSPFFSQFWNYVELRLFLIEELFGFCEALSKLTRSCQRIRKEVEREFVSRVVRNFLMLWHSTYED
jgi:hypothetical protein